jgi:poly(A) polymerase
VFDPLGGAPDIAARRVRFIGEASQRIGEDYLRILRFFRFTAEFADGAPDADGLAACVRERHGLAVLSGERVRQELLRLLAARRGGEVVGWMFDYGLLAQVLGAAPRPALLERLDAILRGLGKSSDAVLSLAVLTVAVPEDADRLMARLKLSNEEHGRLLRAAQRAPEIGPSVPETIARAYLYREGTGAFRDHVLLAWAQSGDPPTDQDWRRRLALPERWQPPRFPIGGDDVMALGIATGPRVGAILRALEAWWIERDFAADEGGLRARLKEIARSSA